MSTCPLIPQCCDNYLYNYEIAGDTSQITAQLTGLAWELPCLGSITDGVCNCDRLFVSSSVLKGSLARLFSVRIRIRGAVETKQYFNGVTNGYWTVGGTPDDTSLNTYKLTISNPSQTYYLNTGVTGGYCVPLDYMETITIAVGATVTLTADSIDNAEYGNLDSNGNPITIADDDPAHPIVVSQPYNGQFLQLDALSATLI